MMTKQTIARLRQVKMLLNLVDSFTPILSMPVRSRVMPRAQKSGYSERKETLIGMASLKCFCMVLFTRLSSWPLYALATLAVPMTYSSNKFQPMMKATNSPTVT